MAKSECLVFSNGLVDIFIFRPTMPTIPMSDRDCLDIAIKDLTMKKKI